MLDFLFGGTKAAEKTLDIADKAIGGIGGWIDGKDFTPQEKAEMWSKAVDSHLRLVEATQNENSVRSITRRYLAWGVAGFTLTWASIGMIFAIFGKEEVVDSMIAVSDSFHLGMSFLAVMGFYFGVQLLRK